MNSNHILSVGAVVLLGGFVWSTGCGSDPVAGGSNCAVGSEGCACTPGGSCDNGLTCLSSKCVNAGAAGTGGSAAGTGGTNQGSSGASGGVNAGAGGANAGAGGASTGAGGASAGAGGVSGGGTGGATSDSGAAGGGGTTAKDAAAGMDASGAACEGKTCNIAQGGDVAPIKAVCLEGKCTKCSAPAQCISAYGETFTCSAGTGACVMAQ